MEIKAELIAEYIENNKISKSGFCKACRIGNDTYEKLIAGEASNIISLFKIARFMNIGVKQLIIE